MKRSNPNGGLVYSTDSGPMCPMCRQPVSACTCGAPATSVGDGRVRVSRETKGRAGKGVTLVRGLVLAPAALAALARELRSACGAGGTVKDGIVEIQGDHRDKIVAWLQDRGHPARPAGG